jgi:hypothetical protein
MSDTPLIFYKLDEHTGIPEDEMKKMKQSDLSKLVNADDFDPDKCFVIETKSLSSFLYSLTYNMFVHHL